MLLAERQIDPGTSPADAMSGIRLRVRSVETANQFIALPHGKTTIGSSPRCNLRIQRPDVRPLHLLIVRDLDRLTVRSWASDTRLNGEQFQESLLSPGDCLSLGSVDIEIEDATTPGKAHWAGKVCRFDDFHADGDDGDRLVSAEACAELSTVIDLTPLARFSFAVEPIEGARLQLSEKLPALAAEWITWHSGAENPQVSTKEAHFQLQDVQSDVPSVHDEWRMDEQLEGLKRLIQLAVVECDGQQPLFSGDKRRQMFVAIEGQSAILPSKLSNSSWVRHDQLKTVHGFEWIESARSAGGHLQLGTQDDQPIHQKPEVLHEINDLLAHLDNATSRIAESERELTNLKQEQLEWAAARNEWERDRAELKKQLAASEAQLTEYVQCAEKLQQELAAARPNTVVANEIHQLPSRRSLDQPAVDDWTSVRVESSFLTEEAKRPSAAAEAEFDWSTNRSTRSSDWAVVAGKWDLTSTFPTGAESSPKHESTWEATRLDVDQSPIDSATPPDESNGSEVWPDRVALDNPSDAVDAPMGDESRETHDTPQIVAVVEPSADSVNTEFNSQPDDEFASFAEFSIWNQGATRQHSGAESELSASLVQHHSLPAKANGIDSGELADTFAANPSPDPIAAMDREKSGDNNEYTTNGAPIWSTRGEQGNSRNEHFESSPEANSETSSLIDRNSHSFANDHSGGEPSSTALPLTQAANENLNGTARNNGVAGPVVSSDDEESIEQYMAKLLQRVRGDSPRTSASQAPVAPRTDVPPSKPEPAVQPAHTSGAGLSARPTSLPQAAEIGEEYLTTSLGTVRRKSAVDAQTVVNLEAFRALANESARRAIGNHALLKHRRDAVSKAIVATLAGMTSVFMMLEAPGWFDLQFVTAGVTLMIAAYWAGQTWGTMRDSFRAAAYDGPEVLLDDESDLSNPCLPIDVER